MKSDALRTQPILTEGGPEEIRVLERLWESDETFAYIPERTPVARAWIEEALHLLPDEYRVGHFLLLTSGSTGHPKLVVGRKDRSERLARQLHESQESQAVRETILSLPLTYCYAFVNQWLWSRVTGRRLVFTRGLREPDAFLKAIRSAEDAMLCLVGPQAALLLQMCGDVSIPGVIRIHFAGGRFPQERLAGLRRVFPNAVIFNNYGCAEAMPRLTLRAAGDAGEASDIGLPLPGVRLQTAASGELLFLSEYRCVAQVDADGFRAIPDTEWIPSGDLAMQREDGGWDLLGRAGEVFKRYGEKVALPQVLSTVKEHWAEQIGHYRERDGAGEDGYVLVLCPAPSEPSVKNLLQAFRARHPRSHWPLRIEGAEALPLLPNGKIDGLALKTLSDKSLHWRQRI